VVVGCGRRVKKLCGGCVVGKEQTKSRIGRTWRNA
jgi:hypothetical protein